MTSGLSMISWPEAFKSHSYHPMALLQKVWTILRLSIIRHLCMHKKQKLHILPVYEIALADAFFKITPQYFLNVLIERQKVSLEPQKSSHKRSKKIIKITLSQRTNLIETIYCTAMLEAK